MRHLMKLLSATAILFAVPFHAQAAGVDLGTAGQFAVLAGSSVANTGPTVIFGGDVGAYPGSSITGFPPGTLTPPNTFQTGPVNAFELGAQNDLSTAYNQAAGLAPTQSLTGQDLGGLTLTPGVYFFSSTAQLTGTLTLNDQGDPNALFVFQIGSTLTTASNSSVVSINTGLGTMPGCDVFWQVTSSATLGADTAFEGHILALTDITLNSGATILDGSALAQNGAVTLNTNSITNCITDTTGTGGPGGNTVPVPTPLLSGLLLMGVAAVATHRARLRPAK